MKRSVRRSTWRGFNLRCPNCGHRHLLTGYLTVEPRCRSCGEDFTPQRADDAPPYFTIIIVGHMVVPLIVVAEKLWSPPIGISLIFWLPLIAGLTLWLLPKVKGAIVGLQWGARLHGFGAQEDFPANP